jgi:hypothetical protein
MSKRKLAFGALLALGTCLSIPRADAAVSPAGFYMKIYKFAVSESADCSNPLVVYENATPDYVDFTGDPVIGSSAIKDGTYPCVIFEVSDAIRFSPTASEGACEKGVNYMIDVCADHSSGPGPGSGGGPGSSGGGPGSSSGGGGGYGWDGGGPGSSSGGGGPGYGWDGGGPGSSSGGGGPGYGGDGGGPGSSSGGGGPGSGGPGSGGPGSGGPGSGGSGTYTQGPPTVHLIDGTVTKCSAQSGVEDRVALYLSTASVNLPGDQKSGNTFEPPGADGKNGLKLNAPLVVKGAASGTFVVDARGKVSGTGNPQGVPSCDMQPPAFSFE